MVSLVTAQLVKARMTMEELVKKLLKSIDRARGELPVRVYAGIKMAAKWVLTVISWVLMVAAVNAVVLCTPSMTRLGVWLPKAAEAALLVYVLMSGVTLLAWGTGMGMPGWKERVAAMPRFMKWVAAALVVGVGGVLVWGMMVWYGRFSKAVLDLIRQLSLAANCPG